MKIKAVKHDNRKKAFEVTTASQRYWFPYAKLETQPSPQNPIKSVYVDEELAGEAFTYELLSGDEGTVHIDYVLEYNRDPRYMRDLLLYKLTLVAQERVKSSSLSKRELIRRLGTSPAQLYRLLDQTNYAKSIDQLLALLSILDCEVDLVKKEVSPNTRGCRDSEVAEALSGAYGLLVSVRKSRRSPRNPSSRVRSGRTARERPERLRGER